MRTSAQLEEPSAEARGYVLNKMEDAYSKCVFEVDDDFDSYQSFSRALGRVDRLSSPGYPYCRESTTNGEFLGWDGFKYQPDRVARLWHDVRSVFETCNADCMLRLFIKNEPHSKEKVASGRFRIILAAPLNIQICWHMVFDKMNDLEIDHCYHIPSQQGIVLPGGGWKQYTRQWKSRGYDTGLDKRAWDWTVPGWLIDLELSFRHRMARGNRVDAWLEIATELYRTTFRDSKLLCSDGTVYIQEVPGVMKSGCVNTISANSHMQCMVHIFACREMCVSIHPLPVCCGDDTLQCQWQATDLSIYAKYGAIVKSASSSLEFVGHEFTEDGPIPLYFDKHVVKSLHVKDADLAQYFDAMARMYCKNRPQFGFWVEYARQLGIHLRTREYYNYWYDYE